VLVGYCSLLSIFDSHTFCMHGLGVEVDRLDTNPGVWMMIPSSEYPVFQYTLLSFAAVAPFCIKAIPLFFLAFRVYTEDE
jgi:hypothetical protein